MGRQADQPQGEKLIRAVSISCSAVSSDGCFCIVVGALISFEVLCHFEQTMLLT